MDRGALSVLAGALCFSLSGTIRALFMPLADPFSMTLVRSIGGAVLLGSVSLLAGQGVFFRPFNYWFSARFLTVFLGLLAFQFLFFAALPLAGVTVATVVTIGTVPISVGLLSWILFKAFPSPSWCVATVLALVGVALLGVGKDVAMGSVSGVLCAVGAGCSYGVFVIASGGLLRHRPPAVVMTVVFAMTSVIVGFIWTVAPMAVDCSWVVTPRGVCGMLLLVFVATGAGYFFTMYGLANVSASTASTMALGEPMGAAIWGVMILGESVTPSVGTGLAFLSVSMVLMAWRRDIA